MKVDRIIKNWERSAGKCLKHIDIMKLNAYPFDDRIDISTKKGRIIGSVYFGGNDLDFEPCGRCTFEQVVSIAHLMNFIHEQKKERMK